MQHRRIPSLARLLCFLVGVAAFPAAQAQYFDRGWTVEIGIGKTDFKNVAQTDVDALVRSYLGSFNLPVQTLNSTLDTKDRSLALAAGYRVNRWLGLEASLFKLGSFRYASTGTVSDAGTIRNSTANVSYRVKGIMLGGTATLPLGRNFELRARAGLSNSDVRLGIDSTVGSGSRSDGISDSSQDLYYGAGVGIILADYYRIGLDYSHHGGVGKASSTGKADVNNVMLSVGFRY